MKKIILILLLCYAFIDVKAQLFPTLGGQRVGISTAQFLKIGVGGRASALGDAFIAIANDVSALYWNPAGLVQFENDEIIFSHNNWVVDINHDFLGGVYHFGNSAIGLAVTGLSMDDMPVTTEFAPFGTGQFFGFSDVAIALTYSQSMTDKFSFGVTVRYIEETLDKLKMRGVMIDIGTYYWTGLGSTRFAVTVSNFGSELAPDGKVVLVGNRGENSDWQSFAPPTMFRIGFAFEPYETKEHKFTTSIQLNHPNDNSENFAIGLEYVWRSILFLRGGYKFNVDEQNYSFGAGLNVPISIAHFTLDYAFTNFERLGSVHRFSIILGF
jgi:Uncharacterised protein family (UPF0164)